MISTFLATCVLVHGHDDGANYGAKGASFGDGYDQNFGAKGASVGDGYDQFFGAGDRLGIANPGQGGKGEGCRNGSDGRAPCDLGLRCNVVNQGSFTTGTCVEDNRGGRGEPCRNGANRCNRGLYEKRGLGHASGQAEEVTRCRCEPDDYSTESNEESGDDNSDSSERLGHGAPHTGRLGEPCSGLSCDSGLYCKINNHGSYTTGTCVHETQHAGGEGQRCRTVQEGSPCDSGLRCNRVRFYPQGFAQICQRDQPVTHPGQEGQRCRTVQEGSPCDSGLRCNYANKCERDQRQHPGQKGQPCRTVQQGSPCEPGLTCQRVRLVPSGFRDICQDVAPHNNGENGQKCNDPPLAPCNHNNLAPRYDTMYPSGRSCTCHLNLAAAAPAPGVTPVTQDPKLGLPAPDLGGWYEPCRNTYPRCNGALYCNLRRQGSALMGRCEPYNPSPSPQPSPQPNRGSEGQRCRNGANQCDYGLEAVTNWENQYGQALQYPVCRCQRPLLGAGDKLDGVATPALGTKGNACRNGSDGQKPCDHGLHCLKTQDGQAILGVCVEKPKDHGGEGQKCYSAPLSPCDSGLTSTKNDEGHCVCQKKVLGNGDDPKLGLPTPNLGAEGKGCRNGSDGRAPCNLGLYCDTWREGRAVMGTCERYPSPSPRPDRNCGGAGERCCGGNYCDAGLEAVNNNGGSWEHQYGQAFEYPVGPSCRCEALLYGQAPGGN